MNCSASSCFVCSKLSAIKSLQPCLLKISASEVRALLLILDNCEAETENLLFNDSHAINFLELYEIIYESFYFLLMAY